MQLWIGTEFDVDVIEGILSDNGGNFGSEGTHEVASLLNLEVCTTDADCPFLSKQTIIAESPFITSKEFIL